MKIIDLHSHINTGSKHDVPETAFAKKNAPFIISEYKSAGISAGGISTFPSVLEGGGESIYKENDYLKRFSEENELIYQWLVLDPREEMLFSQIRENIGGKKVLGIKIHSPYHKYDIMEYGDKIFSFADELGCFVLMHPDRISDMVSFADKYPNMSLIIAHIGSIEHIEAIENAKHGNIYTDTSGMASFQNNIIEYAVERIGSKKIFFGTDTYSCGFQRGRIEYARISEQDKENIFYKNAKKHFSQQFENV